MPKLVIQCQGQEWTVDLKQGSNTFGRASGCTVPLKDPSLSRQHCEIVLSGGSATLVDKGSMNGTLVNGRRAYEQSLQAGDKITIGQVTLWYERKNVAAEASKQPSGSVRAVAASDPSVGSQVATRRAVAAVSSPAPPSSSLPAGMDAIRGRAEEELEDYSFRGGGGGGWIKGVAIVGILAALGVGGFMVRDLLARKGGAAEDAENLLGARGSFDGMPAGKPEGWQPAASRGEGRADRAASTIGVDPTQGRNGTPCMVVEKASSPSDLVLECAYAEEFAFDNRPVVEASAWTRFPGFNGSVAFKVDWLQRLRGALIAEEFSLPVARCEGWTSLSGSFTRPSGAGAFRISIAVVGRGGRVFIDDVAARLSPGGAPRPEQKVKNHRVLATPQGVGQIDLRGRRSFGNVTVRLESDKEGSTLQALAAETSMTAEEGGLVFRGKMPNPIDLREIEFEERLAFGEAGLQVVYQFFGPALRQVDRVSILLTLPRSATLQGLPDPPDQPTGRAVIATDEGDLVLNYELDPARLKTRTVDGRLRLIQTFPVDASLEDPAFGFVLREAGPAGAASPEEQAAQARAQSRFGEALILLRGHVRTLKEPEARARVEGEIHKLEEGERLDWQNLQSLVFQAGISRRPEVVRRTQEAIDRFLREWAGAGVEGKTERLRQDLASELKIAPDAESERARRILERARKLAESGQKGIARLMLQTLVARYPNSDAKEEALQLLKTLGQ
jgi:hypothetical protein